MNNGAFGENFPYSNFHDLNMDWIIKIAKDFLDQYTNIQQIISDGETALQNLTAEGLQQLQEKADNLEGLLQAWYNTHSQDIANQLANALADLNAWYNTHQGYLDQYLQDSIADFNTAAEAKAAQTIATIPDDYTALFNRVDRIKTGLFDSEYETTYVDGYINNSGSEVVKPKYLYGSDFHSGYAVVKNYNNLYGIINTIVDKSKEN